MAEPPEPHVLTPQSIGGFARAEKLSPERRREIARRASLARWGNNAPKRSSADEALLATLDETINQLIGAIQSTRTQLNLLRRRRALLKKKLSARAQ